MEAFCKEIKHKGYRAALVAWVRHDKYAGHVVNLSTELDIYFEGSTIEEAKVDFKNKIDEYLKNHHESRTYPHPPKDQAISCGHCGDALCVDEERIQKGYGPVKETCPGCQYDLQCECCIGEFGFCQMCEQKYSSKKKKELQGWSE